MNPRMRTRAIVLAKRLLPLALSLFLVPGCWVTKDEMTQKFNDFDEYLKKRDARAKTDAGERMDAVAAEVAELRKAVQVLEISLRALKEEVVAIRGNMGLAFESAQKVKDLGDRVQETLNEIREIEGRLKRSVADMGGKVDATLDKYREVLLEEKRVLMERLRALNESLRALNEGEPKDEKK